MRGAWLVAILCWGCSSSATNDNQNATGGSAGASAGGSGGVVTGGTGGAVGGAAGVVGTGGLAGAGPDGGAGTGGDPCRNDALKINEVSTTGSVASDEFIELYNPKTTSVSLENYSLQTAGPGGTPATVWVGGAGKSIAGNGFFVIGGSSYTGTTDGTISTGSIPNEGGVGLFVEESKFVDRVAYGESIIAHPFLEGAAAHNDGIPPSSMARWPDGHDCDNNSIDFVLTQRTPGGANL